MAQLTTKRMDWAGRAARVLDGEPMDQETALAVLRAPDEELLSLLQA